MSSTPNGKENGLPGKESESGAGAALKGIIKDDILGASDWKRSKFGYITGATPAKRAVESVGQTIGDSFGRTSGLMKTFLARENVPSLDHGGETDERFEASMALHGRTENDLKKILRNTKRSVWLYGAMSIASILLGIWSIYQLPPQSIFGVIARFGPLPLIAALGLKHAYTNWMVRRRRLDPLHRFLMSGDWLPRGQ